MCPFVKRQGNTGCSHCDNYGRWDCECQKHPAALVGCSGETNKCENESRKGKECVPPAFSSDKRWCRWCSKRLKE